MVLVLIVNMKDYNPQYFEGVLQLRNPNNEVIRFIKNQLEKNNEFIAKEKKLKEGYDYHISSQKFLRRLGKKLKENFKGELKVNYRLYSRDRQTSKNIYRINVFFSVFQYKKGDKIDFRGDKLKIVSIGKDVFCKNIKTGEKVHLDFDKVK